MSSLRAARNRAAAALTALLLGLAPWAGAAAQEDHAALEQRVQTLELLADQLRAELNAARAEIDHRAGEDDDDDHGHGDHDDHDGHGHGGGEDGVHATGGGFHIGDAKTGHKVHFEGGISFEYHFFDGIYNGGRTDPNDHGEPGDGRGDSASQGQWSHLHLGFEGSYGRDWEYGLEVEFEEEDSAVHIETAQIVYRGFRPFAVQLGRFIEPFTMNEFENEFDSPLIAPPLMIDALGNLGAGEPEFGGVMIGGYHASYNRLNWALGVFDDEDEDADGDTSFAYTGRLALAPKFADDHFMHFGVAYSLRDLEGANLRVNSNLGVSAGDFVDDHYGARVYNHEHDLDGHDNGGHDDDDAHGGGGHSDDGGGGHHGGGLLLAWSCVDDIDQLGLEFAWARGPLALQAEYVDVKADGAACREGEGAHGVLETAEGGLRHGNRYYGAQRDLEFDSHYVQLSWALTGETRPYLAQGGHHGGGGYFGRLRPLGPWGAFELVARIEELDIDDERGGDIVVDKWLLGANWYANDNVRFLFNYIDAEVDDDSLLGDARNIGDDDGEAWSFSAQYAW